MLGDIHEHQILDYKYRAAYCGSCLQQNYGENLNKGYLLWNIESKDKHSVDFVRLTNVCPYYTIRLKDDLQIFEEELQKKSRIKVCSRQLSIFEKKALTDKIETLYDPVELIFDEEDSKQNKQVKICSDGENIKDLTDIVVQERLIRDFLQQYNLSEESLLKIIEVNKDYNVQARADDDVLRNVQYRFGKMSFANTFSYGEDNVFDFSKHKGLVGVFGKNTVGKSSLVVDIPLYCIFNKVSKKGVVKNDLIINENKEDCGVELEVNVGKDKHIIRRVTHVYLKAGKKIGDPVYQGKTDVQYEVQKADGTAENRNGEERSTTDKNIKEVFGTIDDFLATSMAPQWQLLGIVDAGATERQKLIGRYFDIDIFEKKYKLAKEDWKIARAQLKLFEDRNFDIEISNLQQQLNQLNCDISFLVSQKDIYNQSVKKIDDKRLVIQSQSINYSTISLKDESVLRASIGSLDGKIAEVEEKRNQALQLNEKKNSFNIENLNKKKLVWDKILSLRDKVNSLKNSCTCKHEEKCPMHLNIQKFLKQAADLEVEAGNFEDICKKIAEYNEIIVDQAALHGDKLIKQMKENLKSLQDDLNFLKREKENAVKNKELFEKIKELRAEKAKFEIDFSRISDNLFRLSSKVGSVESSLLECQKSKAQYEELKKKYEVFDYFLMAMSKDGIVKRIISDNLNIVNVEIKKIMEDVGFDFELVSEEEGKAIEIYYIRNGKRRNCSLLSGMEKTLLSLMLRVALINITTLPKSNVLFLDEVFQSLDAEWRDVVFVMLQKLKNYFDCVYIITHDEQLKDIADEVIEIYRDEQGYSRIS